MTKKVRRTKTGKVLTSDDLDQIADEAATTDHDVQALRARRRGRPLVGSAPGEVVPVRMDPALRDRLTGFAEAQDKSVSAIVREAVTAYIG